MAKIYKFSDYYAPRLLRSFSQQAEGVVHQFENYSAYMDTIHEKLCGIQEAQIAFDSQLSTYLNELEEAKAFAQKCAEACELDSVELMTQKRDQIIQEMPQKKNLKQRRP